MQKILDEVQNILIEDPPMQNICMDDVEIQNILD